MEKRELVLPIALSVACMLGGCATNGGGEVAGPGTSSPSASLEPTPTIATGPRTSGSEATDPLVMLRFNYREEGSTIIQTYVGPGESTSDRQPNGRFNHGETQPVECRTTGRYIPVPKREKKPGETEEPKDWSSAEWVRLGGFPVRYATLAYGDLIPAEATLKQC